MIYNFNPIGHKMSPSADRSLNQFIISLQLRIHCDMIRTFQAIFSTPEEELNAGISGSGYKN